MDQKNNAFLTPISIIVAGLIIAGGIILKDQVKISFGNQTPTVAGEKAAQPTPTAQTDLTALTPTSADTIIGNKDAKVTVTVFSDFACPYCQAAAGFNKQVMDSLKSSFPTWEPAIPNLIKDYVNTGKIKMIFREFPLHGPQAAKAAEAAQCASEQGKYVEMADKMFDKVSDWYKASEQTFDPSDKFIGYASELGIDISGCLKSGKHTADVSRDQSDGQALKFSTPDQTTPHGITGTPTFFINQTPFIGAQPYSEFKKAIDALL